MLFSWNFHKISLYEKPHWVPHHFEIVCGYFFICLWLHHKFVVIVVNSFWFVQNGMCFQNMQCPLNKSWKLLYTVFCCCYFIVLFIYFFGGGLEKRYLDESCDWVQVLQELALAWSTVFGGYAKKNVPLDMPWTPLHLFFFQKRNSSFVVNPDINSFL